MSNLDDKDPGSGSGGPAKQSGLVRRGGAAANVALPDSESPATLRRPGAPRPPPRPAGAQAPPPPGAPPGAPQAHFTQDEDSGDWTLNTPAIKVLPANVGDFPGHALSGDQSSPDLFGGAAPPAADSSPGVVSGPAPTQPQPPAAAGVAQPLGSSAAALQQELAPVRVGHVDPVTLPNALKGERPHSIADDPTGDDPHIGTTISDRYVVDDVLGEGGMGKVYLAHHKVIDKKQAIKILHAELVKDKEAVGRFVREAKAASSIGNPHIVDISDFGETADGSTYFVMEYLDGFTLGDLLEERHCLPVDLILDIALQLTDGLAAAHEQEIVHRDLKPENVTIIKRGQQDHFCKILDFGIAKVSTRVTTEKLTMAGAVFGTPHYMSPEQAAGAAVDLRTDIYSLGVMLYEMISGELPFNADNFMGILTQHMYKAPVPIRALVSAPDCPPGLEAIVLKCLSKKPDGRYRTMVELADDLRRLSAGEIPTAVHEMMARSGSFNVPADYFKKGDAIVPATPDTGSKRQFGPRFAGIVAAVVCVIIALLVLFRDSLSTAQPQAPAGASSDATADASPVDTAVLPQVPSADEAAERHVLIATDPVEAQAAVDGIGVELPASVPVPVGQTVTIEVTLDGYDSQRVVLDGSEKRKTIKLVKKTRSGPPRIIRRPAVTRPKSTAGKPKSGSSEVVDPWEKK